MTLMAISDTSMTDEQLIARAASGNSEAFGQLVRRYQDRLFRGVCHLLHAHADAEDVVQDTFVQAYLKLQTFRQQCAFYTWLYRIALNIVYSGGRRQRTRAQLSRARPVRADDQTDPHGTPDDELQRREDENQLRQALDALSAEHRAILVLRGVEGFDYDTIAQVLELNLGTVRSRLHRARLELRDQLQQGCECRDVRQA